MGPPLTGYYVTYGPITDGFHTLSTYPIVQSGSKYTAFVFGSGFQNQQNHAMAYAYLAGYESKLSRLCLTLLY